MLRQSHPFLDARAPRVSDNVANWEKRESSREGQRGPMVRAREKRAKRGGGGNEERRLKLKGCEFGVIYQWGGPVLYFWKLLDFGFFGFLGSREGPFMYMRTPLGIIPGANPRANTRPCLPAFHLVRRRRQFRDLDFGLIQSWPSNPAGPAGQVFPRESRFFKSYQAQVKTNFKHLNVLLFYFSHATSSIPSNFVCCCMWGKKHTHIYTHKYINIL
jgi:hypothetical protein